MGKEVEKIRNKKGLDCVCRVGGRSSQMKDPIKRCLFLLGYWEGGAGFSGTSLERAFELKKKNVLAFGRSKKREGEIKRK